MTIDEAPSAGTADRLISNALLAKRRRKAEDADGQMTQRLHLLARTLVEKALAGDVMAIKKINERVDGKSLLGATSRCWGQAGGRGPQGRDARMEERRRVSQGPSTVHGSSARWRRRLGQFWGHGWDSENADVTMI